MSGPWSLGSAEPGRVIEPLGAVILLTSDEERVCGVPLACRPHGLGDQLPPGAPAPHIRRDVELGQVGLLGVAPQRRLHAHDRDSDRGAACMLTAKEDHGVLAADERPQPSRDLARRWRRLVVLHIEVVKELRRLGDCASAGTHVDRLDHVQHSAATGNWASPARTRPLPRRFDDRHLRQAALWASTWSVALTGRPPRPG